MVLQLEKHIRDNKYIFLTGPAGTGKSYLTKAVINRFKNPIVTASTGIAALSVGGETIHRLFKINIAKNLKELKAQDRTNIKKMAKAKSLLLSEAEDKYFWLLANALNQSELLVIDEVSMLSDKFLEMIFYRLEQFGADNLNILLVGDFYQLPPVDKTGDLNFMFYSEHWKKFKMVELTKIKRTTNIEFSEIQHKIRKGIYDKQVADFIARVSKQQVSKDATFLYARNIDVKNKNKKRLEELEGKVLKSRMEIIAAPNTPDFVIEQLKKDIIAEETLEIKIGAKVMFIQNNYEEDNKYINGERGIILSVDKDTRLVTIQKDNGSIVKVGRVEFERRQLQKDEDGNFRMVPVVTARQYPIKLAYASTIHKSQGLSLEEVYLNCNNLFEPSQFYVAISRAINPDKLQIKNFKSKYLVYNKEVERFYENSEKIKLDEGGVE